MAQLQKTFIARFYDSSRHQFATNKVVAANFVMAGEVAHEWAEDHYHGRATKIKLESSKGGEVVCSD